MQAELKRLHSPDIPDLQSFCPIERDNFAFLLQAMVGPYGGPGEESFDIIISSPRHMAEEFGLEAVVIGHGYIIMFEYDYARLKKALESFCAACVGESWAEVARKVSRLGHWEYDGYVEYRSQKRF